MPCCVSRRKSKSAAPPDQVASSPVRALSSQDFGSFRTPPEMAGVLFSASSSHQKRERAEPERNVALLARRRHLDLETVDAGARLAQRIGDVGRGAEGRRA